MGNTLVTYDQDGAPAAGVVIGERIYPVRAVVDRYPLPRPTMIDVLAAWPVLETAIVAARAPNTGGTPLATAVLHAPVMPSAVYGSGANFTDHLAEMARVMNTPIYDPKAAGQSPWHFTKVPRNTIIGPGAPVQLPSYATKVDWEVELAAVIGKTAKEVSVRDALRHVAGYTIANDLSARDHVKRPNVPVDSPFAYDWLSQKSFDGSCPLGPAIVPAQAVPDPQNLTLQLWINDELMQSSSTAQMIFSVAEQVAYLSSRTTLHPGDVILTGTPAGVGMAHGRFLRSGDVMRLAIEGLGELTNRIA